MKEYNLLLEAPLLYPSFIPLFFFKKNIKISGVCLYLFIENEIQVY